MAGSMADKNENCPSNQDCELEVEDTEDETFELECSKVSDKTKRRILEAFKDHPCLWNSALEDYKNKVKKVEATKTLSTQFSLTIEELKRVLHSLRTSISRELKLSLENLSFISKWKFFSLMCYLKEEILKSLKKGEEWSEEEVDNMNDVCRFSRDHVVECCEGTVLSCLEPVCLCWRRFGRYFSHHLAKSDGWPADFFPVHKICWPTITLCQMMGEVSPETSPT